MRRPFLAVPLVTLAMALSACGGGDDPADPASKTSGNASASSTPEGDPTPAADDSLCARFNPRQVQRLAKLFDQASGFGSIGIGASMSAPPMETCSFTLGSGDSGSPITIGWSVEPDPKAVDKARDYQQRTNGRYTDLIDLKVPGVDGAFLVSRTGYGQVGDRAISLLYAGSTGASPQQMTKALRLVGSVATDLPVWDPIAKTSACEGVDAEVAQVLGAEADIVRGTTSSDGTPTCRWSTGDHGLTVSKTSISGAAKTLAEDKALFGGKDVAGLGQKAVYIGGADGTTLKVLVAKDEIVQLAVPALMGGDRASLVALAKKLLPNF